MLKGSSSLLGYTSASSDGDFDTSNSSDSELEACFKRKRSLFSEDTEEEEDGATEALHPSKKRNTMQRIHDIFENVEIPRPPTIERTLQEWAQRHAADYNLPVSTMEEMVMNRGQDDHWFAILLTTSENRKTTTHVGLTRSPMRKTALHDQQLVDTKTTHGGEWTLRLVVGPFYMREVARKFKHVWRDSCRKQAGRMAKGIEMAKKGNIPYYYIFPEDQDAGYEE